MDLDWGVFICWSFSTVDSGSPFWALISTMFEEERVEIGSVLPLLVMAVILFM